MVMMSTDKQYKSRIIGFIKELESKLIEREEVIRIVILAFFSMQHVFLYGKPGTGKTLLARTASRAFGDDLYWELQVAYDTKTEQLMGGIVRDDNGKTYRNTEKSILDMPFPFLDEMFKANNKVLNALLTPMLDRIYTEGSFETKIPLITLFGASNEFPEGEEIKPFEDRFMFRYETKRIQDRDNNRKYMRKQYDRTKNFNTEFKLDDIKDVYEISGNVKFSDDLLEEYLDIQETIIKNGISISDRKFGPDSAIKVFEVSAYLNDRNHINYSDLMLLKHIAWVALPDKRKIIEVINNYMFGDSVNIDTIINASEDAITKLRGIYVADYDKIIKYGEEFSGVDARESFAYVTQKINKFRMQVFELLQTLGTLSDDYKKCLQIEEQCNDNIFLLPTKQTGFKNGAEKKVENLLSETYALGEKIEVWLENNKSLFDYNQNRSRSIFQLHN
ncbi:MAG: AAA family ATPase [Campylobacterales bacterium]|nr:AAA family ATPase [Campylobacterales bacterium]